MKGEVFPYYLSVNGWRQGWHFILAQLGRTTPSPSSVSLLYGLFANDVSGTLASHLSLWVMIWTHGFFSMVFSWNKIVLILVSHALRCLFMVLLTEFPFILAQSGPDGIFWVLCFFSPCLLLNEVEKKPRKFAFMAPSVWRPLAGLTLSIFHSSYACLFVLSRIFNRHFPTLVTIQKIVEKMWSVPTN